MFVRLHKDSQFSHLLKKNHQSKIHFWQNCHSDQIVADKVPKLFMGPQFWGDLRGCRWVQVLARRPQETGSDWHRLWIFAQRERWWKCQKEEVIALKTSQKSNILETLLENSGSSSLLSTKPKVLCVWFQPFLMTSQFYRWENQGKRG